MLGNRKQSVRLMNCWDDIALEELCFSMSIINALNECLHILYIKCNINVFYHIAAAAVLLNQMKGNALQICVILRSYLKFSLERATFSMKSC